MKTQRFQLGDVVRLVHRHEDEGCYGIDEGNFEELRSDGQCAMGRITAVWEDEYEMRILRRAVGYDDIDSPMAEGRDFGNWSVYDSMLELAVPKRKAQPGDHLYRCVGPAYAFDVSVTPGSSLEEVVKEALGSAGEPVSIALGSVVKARCGKSDFTLLRKE